jgi:hypothetical protein
MPDQPTDRPGPQAEGRRPHAPGRPGPAHRTWRAAARCSSERAALRWVAHFAAALPLGAIAAGALVAARAVLQQADLSALSGAARSEGGG